MCEQKPHIISTVTFDWITVSSFLCLSCDSSLCVCVHVCLFDIVLLLGKRKSNAVKENSIETLERWPIISIVVNK